MLRHLNVEHRAMLSQPIMASLRDVVLDSEQHSARKDYYDSCNASVAYRIVFRCIPDRPKGLLGDLHADIPH